MYELVLEKSAHPPDRCLFVDDKPAMLEPAKDAGMTTIAFENPEQLEADLNGHGLQF